MKSSVRILAIALALAFLLLARTAFQDDPTASAAAIDLKDGEASFADLLDGTQEAEYIGFRGQKTTMVYFYVESEDLGTKVTTRTTNSDITTPAAASTVVLTGTPAQIGDLRGANHVASAVDGVGNDSDGTTGFTTITGTADTAAADNTAVRAALDTAYCAGDPLIYVSYSAIGAPGIGTKADTATTSIPVEGWGLATTTTAASATAGACLAPGDGDRAVDDRKLLGDEDDEDNADRMKFVTDALNKINQAEIMLAKEQNALRFEYQSGNKYVAATSTNPARRYTNAATTTAADNRDMVGSESARDIHKPLSGVVFKVVDTNNAESDATPVDPPVVKTTTIPTFESDNAGGGFRLAYTVPDAETDFTDNGDTREFVVDATFDIVDVYEGDQGAKSASDPYAMYTSGFKRAYVSSGSDQGVWVTIREVADETNNMPGAKSATSNLFQGAVEITNDASKNTSSNVYAQDGDTLTLQVYSSNDNRSSNVIAMATAIIDGSEPTIADLSPADEDVIKDATLQISFSVEDEGAGVDFREVDEKKVVTMIQVRARDESADNTDPHKGTGTPCLLTTGDDDIGNAGGNASRVGILVSPKNTTYTDRCAAKYDSDGMLMDGTVVDTEMPSDNGHGVKFNLIITSEDLAGNVDTHTTQLTIDTVKPRLATNPTVGQTWNADKNAAKSSPNSILVQFTESLDVNTVAASDFTVAGHTIDSIEVVGTNEDDGDKHLNEFVVLTLTEDLSNDARPSVTVSGVADVAGNMIDKFTSESDNKIKAKVTVTPFSALVAEKGEQAISFTSDEALFAESGGKNTQASVNGAILSVKVAADTLGGSATFKQNTYRSDGSRAFGVIIRAVDANGNNTDVGAVSVTDEDHKLEANLTTGHYVPLDNWPPADSDLMNGLAGEVKAYVGSTLVASSTEVDWKNGKVKMAVYDGLEDAVLDSIKKDDTITLKYKYVKADQVIQVDVDAPTMKSNPEDNSETDYAAGAIQFIWTEDKEYAGDTYKTVTLNSAMHEAPSGTSTDILAMLTTHDDKTWVYRPAEDLALGDHEFTVKATDAAGNSKTETVTITVIERKPVKINLGPGWNLISFPGMPASVDVNDVFGADSGVTVVSQYDGRKVSPWTVWTRGEDGSLSSSPAGRTTIDSGLGLYVLSSDGTPLSVDIPGVSKDAPAEVPPSIDVIAGWNLVAVILIGDRKMVGVNEYLPEGAWTRAFRLNNTTGQFESFSPLTRQDDGTFTDDKDLMAGDALWVYATEAAVIVPK